MLSHLRFHRRAPSNPASPIQEHMPTSPSTSLPSPLPFDNRSPDGYSPATNTSTSTQPPTLPTITRVTSAGSEASRHNVVMSSQLESRPLPPQQQLQQQLQQQSQQLLHQYQQQQQQPQQQQQQSMQPMQRSHHPGNSGFIGGVALRNYQRNVAAQGTGAPDHLGIMKSPGQESQHSIAPSSSSSRPTLSPINTSLTSAPSPQFSKLTKASSPAEKPTNAAQTGRRPAGTRLTTDFASSSSNAEVPKAKKALPFLRNSMSTLLMRRKTSHNVPDLALPLGGRAEEPAYDPRIRGTRVHDFSAPRQKKIEAIKGSTQGTQQVEQLPPAPEEHATSLNQNESHVPATQVLHGSNASVSLESKSGSTHSQAVTHTSSVLSANTVDSVAASASSKGQAGPPVPPKDSIRNSLRSRLSSASNASAAQRSSASTRTNATRELSLSGKSSKEFLSALPRHMKSTSSRFSFDMIGAAKQEKLLEERHRQRELEKKTAEPQAERDTCFDDFDDDGFDYDAMMDDDGYEEEIPMVGEDDYEEEIPTIEDDPVEIVQPNNCSDLDDDPDNDQENFSGFVFQRSNPASSLASPRSAGILPTPRDTEGNVIGFAMSRDTPGLSGSYTPELLTPDMRQNSDVQAAGLGIQGLDLNGSTPIENETAFQQSQQALPSNETVQKKQDDLYFDGGILGFENEFAEDLAASPEWDTSAPFDESIFDNNDTDKYGRPIAGAFAQALSQRRQTLGEEPRQERESGITSQLSDHSNPSQTTTHTSISADCQPQSPQNDSTETLQKPSEGDISAPEATALTSEDTMAAYQAALSAAAYQAAASGKFQRRSYQEPLGEVTSCETGNSPSTPQRGGFQSDDYDGFDNDDYGYSYEDMADFELDDDAIIAEANADALANDQDGWYGQEFGFYSTPVAQQPLRDGTASDFEYANGGVFGPKVLSRTISGRMVSREPNLTPITERSEYSNRNSIMSLGMPGFSGTPMQSPGLAQLVMMSEAGDEMTLSSLLRLRSRAWGGSQASLSSRDGSPRSERGELPSSPFGPAFFSPTAAAHARSQSMFSTMSQDMDGASNSGSPTLTMGASGASLPMAVPGPTDSSKVTEKTEPLDGHIQPSTSVTTRPSPLIASISPVVETSKSSFSPSLVSPVESVNSPDVSTPRYPGPGHRHKTSADSISYTKEEDSGETRWIMERRRTSELGQVEILGRQIVEGGRI